MGSQEQEIIRQLKSPVANALGKNRSDICIKVFGARNGLADETLKFLIGISGEAEKAFVLCSSPNSPDMVGRSTRAARDATNILGSDLGRHVIEPLSEGSVGELSFAVYPWLNSLSQRGLRGRLQRLIVRTPVLDWLQRVTEVTRCAAITNTALTSFTDSLQYIFEETELPDSMRATAENACNELKSQEWAPMHTLMHGDLWSGNILVDPNSGARRWRDKFMIIDWAGSVVQGFPIYDLVRLAISFRLSKTALRKELSAHCDFLDCQVSQAPYYLLCALGCIGSNLEHFPKRRYLRMAQSCFSTVSGIV